MDVKSPAAAGSVSRPSPAPSQPAEPSRAAVALRRAGIAVAGVGVAGLTAAACVLSFQDLRALALAGEADPRFDYLYPAAFDALLAIAMIGVLLLRGGRWLVRLQAGVVLTLLFAAAAAAEVTTAVRATVDARQAAVVVAVAPWVMLLLALWLWLLLIKHAAARRTAADAASAGHGRDIVPFPEADLPTAEYPAQPDRSARTRPAPPARPDQSAQPAQPALPVQPGQHPSVEVALDPQAAPPLESVPHHDLPPTEPVVGPTPAPETPEVDELPEAPGAPAPAPGPAKPMRWGDLVRPRQGDLLVHPPRPAVPEQPEPESRVSERVETWDAGAEPAREPEAEVGDLDADTQPIRTIAGEPSPSRSSAQSSDSAPDPDPAHGAEAADHEERAAAAADVPGPHDEDGAETAAGHGADGKDEKDEKDGKGGEAAAPPSGRMRSTPTPPEE